MSAGTRGRARTTADPHARLLARTRRRLAVVVLVLVGALVLAIGAAIALAAVRVLDDEADRALQASSAAFVARLDGAVGGGGAGGGSEDEGAAATTRQASARPPSRTRSTSSSRPDGALVANPGRVPLTELPDEDAVAAARSTAATCGPWTRAGRASGC